MFAAYRASRLTAQSIVLPRRPMVILCLLTLLLMAAISFNSDRLNKPEDAAWQRRLANIRSEVSAEGSQLSSIVRKTPARHVYFLKTHKCASTTAQRIVLTHAIRNNLSIALPTRSIHTFYPQTFSPSRTKQACTHPHYDVMALHALFSEKSRKAMPADTVYVAIVRDPATQMESAFHYYLNGYCRRHFQHKKLTFSQYLPLAIQQYGSSDGSDKPSAPLSLTRYPCNIEQLRFLQLQDFGFDLSEPPTRQSVQAAIMRLDALFDIVLVVERLEEGLILLRDRLGWSTADMLHLPMNFRVNSEKPEGAGEVKTAGTTATTTPQMSQSMSNATRRAAYEWNWGDKMLYDHFRTKMDMAIEQNAVYVREQVTDFRRRQVEFHDRCVVGENPPKQQQGSNSVRIENYALINGSRTSDECRLAAISAPDLFRFIDKQQSTCRKRSSIS